MSLPGSTNPEDKSSPDKADEEAHNLLDSVFESDSLDHNRLDNFNRSESTTQHHPFYAFAGSDPQFPYGYTDSSDVGNPTFGITSSATRYVGDGELIRHGTIPRDNLGEIQNIRSGSLMNDNGLQIDESYDNLTEDLGLNPLIDVDEPTTSFHLAQGFEETNDQLIYSRHTPQQENDGDGTVSAMIPNYYERQYLFSLYAHGFCAPQCHEEIMDTKPPAIDSSLFRQLQQQQQQFPHQVSNYPTQAVQNVPTFDRKIPPVASFPSQSDRSSQENAAKGNELKDPDDAPLPRRGSRYSTRSTNQTKKSKTTKTTAIKAHSKTIKFKRPSTRAESRTTTANDKYVRSSSSQGDQIQPTSKQIQEACTPRKLEALQTWFKRLQELIDFKDANGHSKLTFTCVCVCVFVFLSKLISHLFCMRFNH